MRFRLRRRSESQGAGVEALNIPRLPPRGKLVPGQTFGQNPLPDCLADGQIAREAT